MASRPHAGTAPTTGARRSILLAMSWYDERVHRGIARFAIEHDWQLDARMAYSSEPATGWHGDGVLTKLGCTEVDEELCRFVAELGLPTVDLSMFGPTRGLPGIELDAGDLGLAAAEHLFHRGLRRFAFFPSVVAEPVARRRAGFVRALDALGSEAGIELERVPFAVDVVTNQDWRERERRLGEALRQACSGGPLGVLAFNDEYALDLVHAAGAAGLDVPGEVAILGVDDRAAVCETAPVALSSVSLDFESWGYEAARLLHRSLLGEAPPAELVEWGSATVVARRSTDAIATGHRDVRDAIEFVRANLSKSIGVAEVVDANALSRSGLKTAFVRELGRTIGDEIERQRVDRALELLRTTGQSLEAIASACGYSGPRAVQRAVSRRTGGSPSAYRGRFRGG